MAHATSRTTTRIVMCVECGYPFASQHRQKVCSIDCRQARVARRRSWSFTEAERRAIFDRDEWVCGICHDPVDPSLVLPDLMSVAVDHVIPFARGGRHSVENAQCSHWLCNARKHTHIAPDA